MIEADGSAVLHSSNLSNLSDPGDADPDCAGRFAALNQRVVRVIAVDQGWANIGFGDQRLRVRARCLTPVDRIAFDVGSEVTSNHGAATIRDIIWHFKDRVPHYYLTKDGKRLSKRYVAADLTAA